MSLIYLKKISTFLQTQTFPAVACLRGKHQRQPEMRLHSQALAGLELVRGYQRFFLACDGRKYFATPETAQEKPLAPRFLPILLSSRSVYLCYIQPATT